MAGTMQNTGPRTAASIGLVNAKGSAEYKAVTSSIKRQCFGGQRANGCAAILKSADLEADGCVLL